MISPRRQRFNRYVTDALDAVQFGLERHWLALANFGLATLAGLAALAPILLYLGAAGTAQPIYDLLHAVCHQWPFRSFFLFGPHSVYSIDEIAAVAGPLQVWRFHGSPEMGFQLGMCQRMFTMTVSGLLMGLFYALHRRQLAPPQLVFYFALLLPLAVDGFTQLVGWRESTWALRLATGFIGGVATVWLVFPYADFVVDRRRFWRETPGT